jgi:hypothetical protein
MVADLSIDKEICSCAAGVKYQAFAAVNGRHRSGNAPPNLVAEKRNSSCLPISITVPRPAECACPMRRNPASVSSISPSSWRRQRHRLRQRGQRLQCNSFATVCREFIVRRTHSTQSELVLERPVRSEGGLGHVVLCKILSGAGYRLRPTSKIGEFTRRSSLLSKFGVSLAEACTGGTRDWWRPGLRERCNGYIVSPTRQARYIPDRVCKTRRRVDRPVRAVVAPI